MKDEKQLAFWEVKLRCLEFTFVHCSVRIVSGVSEINSYMYNLCDQVARPLSSLNQQPVASI